MLKSVLWICFCVLLTVVLRGHNLREVFVDGRLYFTDADCYSRMSRAEMVATGKALVVRHHDFENYSAGTTPHTTAPLDWLIVGVKGLLDAGFWVFDSARRSVLRAQTLDLAGALISPLLGAATCVFLGFWARRAEHDLAGAHGGWDGGAVPKVGWAVPLLFAVSPILVHGTLLGRPDHQSLLLLALAVALGAEARLAARATRKWAAISGIAWAFSLWVSFYEPLILLAAVLLLWLVGAPRRLFVEDRILWLFGFVTFTAGFLLIEGWRIRAPDPSLVGYLGNWNRTIGELGHPNASTIFAWLGFGCVVAPFLLMIAQRDDRRAWPMLALLALAFGLTCWQLRWGYFLALIFVMTLPWQLAVLRRTWIVWAFILVSLAPMAGEWDARFFPDANEEKRLTLQRLEAARLRQVAELMRGKEVRPFLAPWWLSPALAYWSGQPGVAGSSHESLAGIVDSARVSIAASPLEAAPILRERNVKWLVADEPSRMISTSEAVLGIASADRPLATLLFEQPHSVAPFLQPVFANEFFKLFAVDAAKFPP